MISYQDLMQFGLSEKEAKVYIASLELGPAPITKIAPKAGLKRTTLYEITESLLNRQLMEVSVQGTKRLFVAAEPEHLKRMIDMQNQLLDSLMPMLRGLSTTAKNRPTVRMFEGESDLKKIYEDTIREKKPIYAFVGVAAVVPGLYDYLTTTYVRLRKKNAITAYVIAPKTKEAGVYKKEDKANLRETKLIDTDKYPFSIEINMYGNKVALISFNKNELFGTIIESAEIARTMKTIFNFFWDHV